MTAEQITRNAPALTAIDTAWAIEKEEIRKEQEHPLHALANDLRYIFHRGSADHRYPKKVIQAIEQAKDMAHWPSWRREYGSGSSGAKKGKRQK